MEVRIGIMHSPREISFETDVPADEVRRNVEEALDAGRPLVAFADTKGKNYLVPVTAIAYVEVGGDAGRRVGFIN